MAIEKTLLLKGLAGVAALGSVGGVGGVVIKNKLDERAAEEKKKEDEQKNLEEINSKKKAKKEEVNGKLKTLGIEGCDLEDKDVTSPTVFSKNCELDQDKFSKIHFSNRGDNDVNVEGWTNGNINLKIENKEGGDNGIKFTFSGAPSDLIVKGGDNQDNKFSIKANKKTEFEEKPEGKLKKKFDDTISTKLKGYNTKLGNLSLPASCRFDETEDEKKLECEIKGSELKTVNFTNKGNGQLTLSGLDDTGKIKLIIDREGTGETETLKYKFKNDNSSKITITGTEGDPNNFSIKASSETKFEEKPEGKLSKIISDQATSTKLKNYNTKFGNLSLPASCRFDETEDEKKLECEIKGSELKNIKFSSKEDNNPLTLSGITDSDKIKLIIDRDTASQTESLKYKLKNDKSSNITIIGKSGEQKKMVLKASSETEFEEKENKLSKIISNQATSTKLKEHNKKLEKLSLPDGCIFDVADTDTSFECSIDKDQIKTIKFSNKGEGNLTISEGSDFTGLKLNISGSGDNLKFNFKGGSQKIKLTNGNKHVFIKKDEENEFKIKEEALHKIPKKVNELAKKVDLVCEYGDSGDGGTCKKGDNKSYLNVSKENASDYETIGIGGDSSSYKKEDVKFNFQEDQAGYEKGVKFTFTGETMVKNKVKLEKNVSYEIKKINDFDCFSKKDPQ